MNRKNKFLLIFVILTFSTISIVYSEPTWTISGYESHINENLVISTSIVIETTGTLYLENCKLTFTGEYLDYALKNYGVLNLVNTTVSGNVRILNRNEMYLYGKNEAEINVNYLIGSGAVTHIEGYTFNTNQDTALTVYSRFALVKDCSFNGGGVQYAGIKQGWFIGNRMESNGLKPNFRMYVSENVRIAYNYMQDGDDNGIRLGGSKGIYIGFNTIVRGNHEAIYFSRSSDILIENNTILEADVGIEADVDAVNYTVRWNYIEVGWAQWGVGLEGEYTRDGLWYENTLVLAGPYNTPTLGMTRPIKIEYACRDLKFINNTCIGFQVGFRSYPKPVRPIKEGGTNILVEGSYFPTIHVDYSYNITFLACTYNPDKVVITNSENITFRDYPIVEPEPEPTPEDLALEIYIVNGTIEFTYNNTILYQGEFNSTVEYSWAVPQDWTGTIIVSDDEP